MIAYLTRQGSQVRRFGQTLQVFEGEALIQTLFLHRLETLVLVGNINLTSGAISLLCRERLETIFLTTNGRYKGRLEVDESKNVFLAQRQFNSLQDQEFCLRLVRDLVLGKQHNMATLVMRLKRRNAKHLANELQGIHDKIQQEIQSTLEAASIDAMRGHEGQATALYYRAIRHGLKKDWGFRKRVRRPPTDPVNSVLSFLSTLLFNRVLAAVRLAGLHPAVGYLHSLDYGRYSLVLDLMEEFRSLLAETTTLSLFNLGILTDGDFYYEELPKLAPDPAPSRLPEMVCEDPLGKLSENSDDHFFDAPEQRLDEENPAPHEADGKRPCRLTAESRKRVISAFEEKLDSEIQHPIAERSLTYSEALLFQSRFIREVIEGSRLHYIPLQMK